MNHQHNGLSFWLDCLSNWAIPRPSLFSPRCKQQRHRRNSKADGSSLPMAQCRSYLPTLHDYHDCWCAECGKIEAKNDIMAQECHFRFRWQISQQLRCVVCGNVLFWCSGREGFNSEADHIKSIIAGPRVFVMMITPIPRLRGQLLKRSQRMCRCVFFWSSIWI